MLQECQLVPHSSLVFDGDYDNDCQNPRVRSRGVAKSGVHVLGI